MQHHFGQKAATVIMAGLIATAAPATTAMALLDPNPPKNDPTVGEQTGTGQTDLTMVLKNGTKSYGGTNDPSNPDRNKDGLGDNIAFTVPTSINYVVKADGSLVGPAEGTAHIDNESVFGIEVDSLYFEAQNGFDIVPDATTSNKANAVDLQIGPAQDMLQMSDYLYGRNIDNTEQWRMTAKETGDSSKVPLKSEGHVANLDIDVTSRQNFGKIQWVVSPANHIVQGVTVNYNFTDTRTGETIAGQKTLHKIHSGIMSVINDILPNSNLDIDEMAFNDDYQLEINIDEQTYTGNATNAWDTFALVSNDTTGEQKPEYLDPATLDGKTLTVRGSIMTIIPNAIYAQGVTANYEMTDVTTENTETGTKTLYEINPSAPVATAIDEKYLPVVFNLGDKPLKKPTVEIDGKTYTGDRWIDLHRTVTPETGEPYEETLDLTNLDGKTIRIRGEFRTRVNPINYSQPITINYELTNEETNDVKQGTMTCQTIQPQKSPMSMILSFLETPNTSTIELDGKTYTGDTWLKMKRTVTPADGEPYEEKLDLTSLDGKTINLHGTFQPDSAV